MIKVTSTTWCQQLQFYTTLDSVINLYNEMFWFIYHTFYLSYHCPLFWPYCLCNYWDKYFKTKLCFLLYCAQLYLTILLQDNNLIDTQLAINALPIKVAGIPSSLHHLLLRVILLSFYTVWLLIIPKLEVTMSFISVWLC